MTTTFSYEALSSQDSSVVMEPSPREYQIHPVLDVQHSSTKTYAPLNPEALLILFGRRVVIGEASLDEEIIARYAPIDNVQRIHLLRSEKAIKVFVWLKQARYNDVVMDKLLDAEEIILERYPQQLCEFHYVPVLVGHRLPLIFLQARLIWENAVYG